MGHLKENGSILKIRNSQKNPDNKFKEDKYSQSHFMVEPMRELGFIYTKRQISKPI